MTNRLIGPMRLNLGSGPHYAPGWVNVDLYEADRPDVTASVWHLPFEDHVFAQVYLGHFLEHLPWGALPRAFQEITRVARPGAEVMAVGPCIGRAVLTGQPTWLLEDIVAPEVWDGSGRGHAWTPTELLTILALRDGGLLDVEAVPVASVVKPRWPNPVTAPWQTAVHGIVPPAS